VSARRPEKLEEAAKELEADGLEILSVPANMAKEEDVANLVAKHKERFGRLDVLVNNAGVGIGGQIEGYETKKLDMQLDVNLRGVYLTLRECIPMLKEAGAEHGKALVVNTASIAGKSGQPWISVYSATKFGVVGFTQAMQKELGQEGIQVTALCPGFVDTPMTEWARGQVKQEEMIQPEDIAEGVRLLLRTSRHCVIPEIVFARPSEQLEGVP
jgi:NAD(P)-dependent dehydrogenase (short-subunit alcohol dehydrogenase family)